MKNLSPLVVFVIGTLIIGRESLMAKVDLKSTGETMQEIATKILDFEVSAVSFSPEKDHLGPLNRGKLMGFLSAKKQNHPRDGQLFIATWSDNELPSRPRMNLSAHDQRLVHARTQSLRAIVDKVLGSSPSQEIVEVEMASMPISDATNRDMPIPILDSELKRSFLEGKHGNKTLASLGKHLRENGGPSRAVFIWLPSRLI